MQLYFSNGVDYTLVVCPTLSHSLTAHKHLDILELSHQSRKALKHFIDAFSRSQVLLKRVSRWHLNAISCSQQACSH